MLDNRDYMRGDNGSGNWFWQRMPAHLVICIALLVIFAVDTINSFYLRSAYQTYHYWLNLTPGALNHGYVWQLITFQFFHGGVSHLFWNLVLIYMFGKTVEERLGKVAFLKIYLFSGMFGGVLQSLLMWIFPDYFGTNCVGASAGLSGIIAAFALIDPEAVVLINFFIPAKAIYILYAETIISLFFILVPVDRGTAHAAHLGGIIFAYWYMTKDVTSWSYRLKQKFFPPKQRRNRSLATTTSGATTRSKRVLLSKQAEKDPEEFISSEVDPILDKISAHGIHSLTDKERDILQAARKKMSKG